MHVRCLMQSAMLLDRLVGKEEEGLNYIVEGRGRRAECPLLPAVILLEEAHYPIEKDKEKEIS